ncbi:MAG: phenylalanine--tRNA ligase subunit beta [Betaproteobacteria bacterium]|nr:phenylalanine--tRNA ligase subunit beta [Betaproteobacteria bacterium]
MQFSESWLRSLANPPLGTDDLTHLLTMSGLEVEECEPVAKPFEGIVVGQVVEAQKHPNADRLKVCKVDAGTGTLLTIVCGAPNVTAGMKAPLAMIGAHLPAEGGADSMVIRRASMRGVESEGMLCSARELGLSEDHSGLLVLPDSAQIGRPVREVLDLDDHRITIKLTPNRADCLSVLGIAREVAALTGTPLAPPAIAPVPAASDARHPVKISDAAGCGRFTGRVIRNVNAAAPTPDWMRTRLERAGQRSISALVDVTNYVMLELGRPLHVYDVDKLQGPIDVRFGRSGETLELLNGQTVTLEPDVLAITDDRGPIGLAGIMGGETTKADLDTKHCLLEAAFFFPEAIAGRARRYNFGSDASHRFERGVDFDNNVDGIERATQLILDICGGEAGPVTDVIAALPSRTPVAMRTARARKVIGVPITDEEMGDILRRLGLAHEYRPLGERDGTYVVTPPSFRFDINIEEDLIEEIARVYGFERIPTEPPVVPAAMRGKPEARRPVHGIRGALADLGYHEVVNFSFVDAQWEADFSGCTDPIKVLNPIASQMSVMRTSLIAGLADNIRYNLNRKQSRVRVFEIGRVFLRDAGVSDGPLEVAGIRQPLRVAGAAFGSESEEQWGEPRRTVDFFDVKGDVEELLSPRIASFSPLRHPALHPGRAANVIVEGTIAGWIGELHPRLQQKYEFPSPVMLFELDGELLTRRLIPVFREVSKLPSVQRDLAVVVDAGIPAGDLLEALRKGLPEIVESVEVFDVYRGKGVENGKRSLAFRVLMQDTRRTLTDAEADDVMARAITLLDRSFGAQLRK